MLNESFYYFYLYALIVVLLPITVVPRHQNIKDGNFFTEELENRNDTLTDALRQANTEFEELLENILDVVAKTVPKMSKDAVIFLEKLSNQTINFLNTFSNQIFSNGTDLFDEMFRNFELQLKSVSQEFTNLAASVDKHFNWAVAQLNYTLINNTEEYDWWTAHIKQKLRTINDTKLYQEGCHAIDAFIISSNKQLYNCCKITMKPMRSLCKSATSLVTEALHITVDAIDRMQVCLEEKSSYLHYMLPCINLAYDEITSLVSRAAQITHQINSMLPMKIIYTRSCFAIVKVDMNVRRSDIESNLFSNK